MFRAYVERVCVAEKGDENGWWKRIRDKGGYLIEGREVM
jgi:hypothetical protein